VRPRDEAREVGSASSSRLRLVRLYVVATLALVFSLLSLLWLAWLSPPTQLVKAAQDEPRVAVPEERLAPRLRIREIRNDIDDLQAQLAALEGTSGIEDLEARVEELEATVTDLESALSDIDDRASELDSTTAQLQSDIEDVGFDVSNLCNSLNLELEQLFLSCP
jgi:septal ring factor EnvC (AmiA/AmiB activator)